MILALALAAISVPGTAEQHGAPPAPVETGVAIVGRTFTPSRVTVLLGERVRWGNQDNAAHTITAEDRSFDSGRVEPGGQFTRSFDRPGVVAYKCSLHRFMRASVDVVAVSLIGPPGPVPHGTRVTLRGRTPAPNTRVTLERRGTGAVAATVSDADGSFSFGVVADAPARYRVGAGTDASAEVAVPVAPQVRLAARRGDRGAVSVRIHVVPAQPGARVVLERHERERFGFVPMRRIRLDEHSRAHAVLHTARRLRLRVRLARPVHGFASTTSGVAVILRRTGNAREKGGHH